MKHVTVYCGAQESPHVPAAYHFGRMLAQSGLGLVYGGGATGLMRAVALGARSRLARWKRTDSFMV